MLDLIIKGGAVCDGSGTPLFNADIGIRDGMIARIGDLGGCGATKVIDASGRVVTPGFIDMHSHADGSVPMWPDMESALGQGVTTCFTGHCGMGIAPIPKFFLEHYFQAKAFNKVIPQVTGGPIPGMSRLVETDSVRKAFYDAYAEELDWGSFAQFADHLKRVGHGCNMVVNVGHSQLRCQIMGYDANRAASSEEIEQMAELLSKSLDEGAYGLSFGFDYAPSNYAEEDELLRLMRVVKEKDAVVTAHMQHGPERRGKVNKDFRLLDGYTEFLELGLNSGARIHISHIYPAFEVAPGENADILGRAAARSALDLIERYREKGVRITWDYLTPYPAACYFFPQLAWRLRPYVTDCGGKQGFIKALQNPWYRNYVADELRSERPNWGKDMIVY
ncbi:MAG: amidohydrolase family protein, partial [Clostridia bacterium]|nr:amidohydrolase family protein [Clostridia bacterium]